MATTINSNTTDGLVITPDTSGEVKIQSNGTDVLTITGSGMDLATGMTLPASKLTGTVPSDVTVASSSLSGALPALDGSSLTGISTNPYTAQSLALNGYIKLVGGLIIQWGRAGSIAIGGTRAITFPISFPTACRSITIAPSVNSTSNSYAWTTRPPSTTGVTFNSMGGVAITYMYWTAIGH
jgi:hypothetical protein